MSFQELKKRWLAVEQAKKEHTRLCHYGTAAAIEAAGMDLFNARSSFEEARKKASSKNLRRLSRFIRSTQKEEVSAIAA